MRIFCCVCGEEDLASCWVAATMALMLRYIIERRPGLRAQAGQPPVWPAHQRPDTQEGGGIHDHLYLIHDAEDHESGHAVLQLKGGSCPQEDQMSNQDDVEEARCPDH